MNEQQRKAMELALEALYSLAAINHTTQQMKSNAIAAIKEVLAQDALQALHDENKSLGLYEPEQEPMAFLVYAKGCRRYFTLTFDVEKVPEIYKGGKCVPLYTTPPQRKPLTDEQVAEIYMNTQGLDFYLNFARAIEAAHGIKE